MKSSAFYAVIGLGVILITCIIWFGARAHMHSTSTATTTQTQQASSTPPLTGLSIYTNGKYGFSIFYPATSTVQTSFGTTYNLPSTWRVNTLSNATGTPIIEIQGYQTKSDMSYPRHFETEVRIGASDDPKEVAVCEKAGNGEFAVADATFGGTTWKVFSLQDAAMMQYVKGTSYRKVHNGVCVAIEQVESGSNYRDASPTPNDIPQAVLNEKFAALEAVVRSFSFAKP